MGSELRKNHGHDCAALVPADLPGPRLRAVQRDSVQEGRRGVQAARAREEVRGARVHVQRGRDGGRQERNHQAGHRQEEAVRE